MAIIYNHKQDGSPALTYGTAEDVNFYSFKVILKACLVTGFGANAGAGWSVANEGDRFLVLRNGAQSGYVCFTSVSNMIKIYLAETYTGMSGNVMTGGGVISGHANGASSVHCVAPVMSSYEAYTNWFMVADMKTFVISWASDSKDATISSELGTIKGGTLYCGEDSDGNFISVGCAGNANRYGDFSFSVSSGYTILKDPKTNALVGAGNAITAYSLLLDQGSTSSYTYTDPITDLELYSPRWRTNNKIGGKLRGIACSPEHGYNTSASDLAKLLGFPRELRISEMHLSMDLGDLNSYFLRSAYHTATAFLVTDNPEFWL